MLVPIVHLLRHCEPAPPDEGDDGGLSAKGAADATALIEPLLALKVARIICSPYSRAIETIKPFAGRAGIPIELDLRLRERHLPLTESLEEHVERVRLSFEDPDYAPPGGESFDTATRRALACLRQRIAETPSGLLLVGHGQCLTLLLRSLCSDVGFGFWRSLPMPAVIELSVDSSLQNGVCRLVETGLRGR